MAFRVASCVILASRPPDRAAAAATPRKSSALASTPAFTSQRRIVYRGHSLLPPTRLKADRSGKYVAAQYDRAMPGQEAALRPNLPMYQFEQSPEKTVLESSLCIAFVVASSAVYLTSIMAARRSSRGAKSDLTAKSTCVSQAKSAELLAGKVFGPKRMARLGKLWT